MYNLTGLECTISSQYANNRTFLVIKRGQPCFLEQQLRECNTTIISETVEKKPFRMNMGAMFVSIGYLPHPRQDYQHPWELLHPYYCCCLAVFESSQWERFQLSLWSTIPQLHAKNYSLHLLVLLQLSAALYWAQMPENHLASFVKQWTYRFEQQQLFSTSSPTQQHRTQIMIPYIHIIPLLPCVKVYCLTESQEIMAMQLFCKDKFLDMEMFSYVNKLIWKDD